MKTTSKDMNKMLKKLKKLGWTISVTGTTHIRVVSPAGQIAVVSNSCSDRRGLLNARSDLRKIGAPL